MACVREAVRAADTARLEQWLAAASDGVKGSRGSLDGAVGRSLLRVVERAAFSSSARVASVVVRHFYSNVLLKATSPEQRRPAWRSLAVFLTRSDESGALGASAALRERARQALSLLDLPLDPTRGCDRACILEPSVGRELDAIVARHPQLRTSIRVLQK